MQHWSTIAAIPGQPTLANGSAISMDRLIPGSFDFAALNQGYVRQNPPSTVLPGSTIHSAQNPYNPHQNLGYHFHPSLSVGTPQSVEPVISARQFQSATLNPSYQLPHFQQSGSASQQISLPHAAPVHYGQSLPYLPSSLVTAIGNGTLGHGHQYANMPVQQQQQQHAVAMANTVSSLKHFGALHQSQHIRRNKPMITSKTNLYISGLNESDTDDTVRALVENVVQPKSCKAMLTNGKCKGSGFIDCATEEDAEKAKAHILDCAKTTGRKLSVKYAFENEKDALNVYVRNLPRMGFTKEMLEELFRYYGNVTSVKLHETDAGLTGIGFVRFATAEEAEKAVEHMNESKRIVGDSDKPITCKLADKAGPRNRPLGNNSQVQAAVVAAASGLHHHHHHQSQMPIGANHLARTGSSLQNASIQALSQHPHLQHQSAAYAPQFQLPAHQLVQSIQQTSVVVPNMQHSTAHTRGVLLPQTLLPNGATGTASVLPVSFAPIGGLNGTTSGNASSNNSYRSNNILGQQHNNQVAVFATPTAAATSAALDSNSSRIKTQSGNFNNSTSASYLSSGIASQPTQSVFPSSTGPGEPLTNATATFQTVLSYVQQKPATQCNEANMKEPQTSVSVSSAYQAQSIQSTPSTNSAPMSQEIVDSFLAPEFKMLTFNTSVSGSSAVKTDVTVTNDPHWLGPTTQALDLPTTTTANQLQSSAIGESTVVSTAYSTEADNAAAKYFISAQDSRLISASDSAVSKSVQDTMSTTSAISEEQTDNQSATEPSIRDNISQLESSATTSTNTNCTVSIETDRIESVTQKRANIEKKRDSSSSANTTVAGKRCTEVGASETTNPSLNRRKKNLFTTNTSSSHKQQQSYNSAVDTRTTGSSKDLNNTTSEIHISSTGCSVLNPTSP